MAIKSGQRFSRRNPCPVCTGFDEAPRGKGVRCYGFLSADGEWCHCTREEHSGGLPINTDSETYAHRMSETCRCGVPHTNSNGVDRALGTRRIVVAEYDYTDEKGVPLYKRLRYHPKGFSYRAADGTPSLKDIRRVPYRLPKVIRAGTIYVVEAEKDVHTLEGWDLTATTAGSADDWPEEFSEYARGKIVGLLPDNDSDGRRDTIKKARSIRPVAKELKVVELPDLPPKGDGGPQPRWRTNLKRRGKAAA